MKFLYKKILVAMSFLTLICLGSLGYANYKILSSHQTFFTVVNVPTSTYALVFGGGMKTPTEMTDMQYDRVLVSIDLYKKHKIQKIFLTGDDGAYHDDEISAMTKLVLEKGVPTQDILSDPHGYRTYESCRREAQVYNVTSTIVISQSFHLPRIEYLCGHFNIQTSAVAADLRDYHSFWVTYLREYLARLKAWWQIDVIPI